MLRNAIARFVANHLPERVVYWAAVRMFHYTMGHADSHVQPRDVKMLDAMFLWHVRHMGAPDNTRG